MTRRSWVYTHDGRTIEKGTPEHLAYLGEKAEGPMISGDEGDFVSPIDGKVYSGKTGMREHCARHNVVNNRDLVGLPVGIDPSRAKAPLSTRERQQLRTDIFQAAQRKGYLNGQ